MMGLQREARLHYDSYYELEPSAWRAVGAVDKVDNVLDLWRRVGGGPEPSVLEIGCGDGAVLAEFNSRGISAVGVEISRTAVEACRGRGLDVRLLDSEQTGYPDHSFDIVVLTHVVEHLVDPRATLAEASRLGRWIAIEVPLEFHWRTPKNYTPTPLGHINTYNMKLIRHLLQSTGLEVVAERVSNVSREVQCFNASRVRGSVKWAIREGALKIAPFVAQRVLTYHGSLMCRPNPELVKFGTA